MPSRPAEPSRPAGGDTRAPGVLAAALLVLAGCAGRRAVLAPDVHAASERAESWVEATLSESDWRRAVLAEGTLRAEHFVPGRSALTSVGRRELHVLVDELLARGGTMRLERGGVSDALYRARRLAIAAELEGAGVRTSGEVLIVTPRGTALAYRVDARDATTREAAHASNGGGE